MAHASSTPSLTLVANGLASETRSAARAALIDHLAAVERAGKRAADLEGALKRMEPATPVIELERALADHDTAESEAIKQWATAGAEGDPPLGDHKARQALVAQLGVARARAAATRSARAELNAQLGVALQDLQALRAATLAAVGRALIEDEAPVALNDVETAVGDLRAALARYWGLREALQAAGLTKLLERMPSSPPGDSTLPSPMEIAEQASTWKARATALGNGEG